MIILPEKLSLELEEEKVDLRPLREIFRALVLKMLKKDDEKGLENLSQYVIRNTFSLEFIASITQHIPEPSFQLMR